MAVAQKTDSITGLLEKLEIKGSETKFSALQVELDRAGFQIFDCVSDKGFLAFKPPSKPSYKSLLGISCPREITQYIDCNGTPEKLVCTSSIPLPVKFCSHLPPKQYPNKFPYGQNEIASLHVAVTNRGVDLKNGIDFVFGGSTLEMLANLDNTDPYMVCRIPGTPAFMIKKKKEYVADFSAIGFQFERLVTGIRMDDLSNVADSVHHLQVMKVGEYRVLFIAETDAVLGESDDNDDCLAPVEVKASNPRYWGTKVMFQMISSGSTKLCHGIKGRGSLVGVDLRSLSSVAADALNGNEHRKQLEHNILKGMDSIKKKMKDLDDDDHDDESSTTGSQAFKIHFDGTFLNLLPAKGRNATLLPPADIVRQLLTLSC